MYRRTGISRIAVVVFGAALAAAAPTAGAQQRGDRTELDQPSKGQGPKGWIGVQILNPDQQSGTLPVIVSVVPGAPAQRAGLMAGDTVVSYNDIEVLKEPSALERLLKPGNRIVVKVRRNGIREIPVTVGTRPTQGEFSIEIRVNDTSGINAAFSGPGMRAMMPILSMKGICGDMSFVGADVVRFTPGLAKVMRIDNTPGVLVTDVADKGPAKTAGLESGDVIVAADTFRVAEPMILVQLMMQKNITAAMGNAPQGSPHRTMRLDVRRNGKPRKLTLRW